MALLLHIMFFMNGMRLTLATSDVYYPYYACYHVPKKIINMFYLNDSTNA
jgi:hypothetical protein